MNTTPKTPAIPVAGASAGAGFKAEIPRRGGDAPATPRRPTDSAGSSGGSEARRLLVGRDITLSGEIASCDLLHVEGTVEARLQFGRFLEITECGLFKGSATVEDAEISGRFEGDLTVRGRLRIRASGRVGGTIKYGELEVECGGQLTGEVQTLAAQRGDGDGDSAAVADPLP